jgi:exodeoxyribonuclease VII large subunit
MELPSYSVRQLNEAIGLLLDRGFAPRFLLEAAVIKPVLKKGHLWLSLSDGDASIPAVVWASTLSRLAYRPQDGDGVTVVGKLNFWAARASLSVQVLDVRPSLSTVLRRFESVKALLAAEGLLALERKRPLPRFPKAIALLTSVPSSALADLLRTAQQRWPACALRVVAIPVQGDVEAEICRVLEQLEQHWQALGIEAVVLARGGGSREDLTVFDGEQLARCLARCPVPVVTGIGHEDDITVADLVADHRAATPTAALVALLPHRQEQILQLDQLSRLWRQQISGALQRERQRLLAGRQGERRRWAAHRCLERRQLQLAGQTALLKALAPERLLRRGYSILRNGQGQVLRRGAGLKPGTAISAQLSDGVLQLSVQAWQPETNGEA